MNLLFNYKMNYNQTFFMINPHNLLNILSYFFHGKNNYHKD